MAGDPKVPGIEVAIFVEDKPLIEYDDPENDERLEFDPKVLLKTEDNAAAHFQASNTKTKYIKSVSDKEFEIKLSVNSPYEFDVGCDLLCFDIYVDGRKVRAPLLLKTNYSSRDGWSQVISGVRKETGHKSLIQKFKFATITTSKSHEPDQTGGLL
jgi:hypothetical protein